LRRGRCDKHWKNFGDFASITELIRSRGKVWKSESGYKEPAVPGYIVNINWFLNMCS